MIKARLDLKVLLIQIRLDQAVKEEELSSFARFAKIEKSQISILDVFNEEMPTAKELKSYDAVFIGGASEASVIEPETYLFVPKLIKCIQDLIEVKVPTFASCFGFQAAVLALGGEIIEDPADFEMGTYAMELSEATKTDSVYKLSLIHI